MDIMGYTPKWQSAVVALADRTFGEGYFARPSEIVNAPGTVMLICCEGDDLYGFVLGRHLPQNGLADFLRDRLEAIPDDIAAADAAEALGAIETVAVALEQRGQRIGTKLLQAIHDKLVGLGADKLIVTFKRGPTASQVDGIMGKLGFELWTRLPSYWRSQCDAGTFRCLDRHDGCSCEALFYRKAVY
jgi:GNAT superfamily N-acetyltransferase